jgi:DNA ligase-associated metallophosphoesterase
MPEIITKDILCRGERLMLTNQRALFWERENMLVVADMHLGKTAHFRRHGIAIPPSVMLYDLERLSDLIIYFNATRLIVVGDMFHAGFNRDLQVFAEWLKTFPDLDIHLVRGNHDKLQDHHYQSLGIRSCSNDLSVDPFYFIHHPPEQSEHPFTISGHIHPGKMIHGTGKQMLKLPCFIINDKHIVLPAFSLFTGLDTRHAPERDNTYFLLTDKGIFDM